jgi:NADH-quinone oxidoreductase subunit E
MDERHEPATTKETDVKGRTASVLARYPQRDPGELVNILHDLQAEFRYLPEGALQEAAAHLGLPEAQVFGVATFYHGFHTEPRGRHTCTVCMGTACHVRGAPRLLEQLERDTGVAGGATAPDLSLTVEEVSCVGACALGPLVLVDDEYHGHMTSERLSRLVKKLLAGEETP